MIGFINSYFSSQNSSIGHYLFSDLERNNKKAIKLFYHPLKNLLHVDGMTGLLKEVATIDLDVSEGNRVYHNYLQELHGIYFVSRVLKHKIIAVENNSRKVFSPYGNSNKSCDIKSSYLGKTYFFESKDRSNIYTTHSNSLPIIISEEEESAKWIFSKAKSADQKGAHYLICRPDLDISYGSLKEEFKDYFYGEWITKTLCEHFVEVSHPSKKEIVVSPIENILSHNFIGIYIVKDIGFIKVIITNLMGT